MAFSKFILKAAAKTIVSGFNQASKKAGKLGADGVESALKQIANGFDAMFTAIGIVDTTLTSANDIDNISGFDVADATIRTGISALAGYGAAATFFAVGAFALTGPAAIVVAITIGIVADVLVGEIIERLQEDYNLLKFESVLTEITGFSSTTKGDYFWGSGQDETVSGGKNADELHGRGGDDTLNGNGGEDTIKGGTGNDTINGGNGRDTLHGGDDTDIITGGNSDDTIHGDDGNDYLYGEDENDTIFGGDGTDLIKGGDGKDFLYGEKNADTIHGGHKKDTIFGDGGKDTLFGDKGNDYISGGEKSDTIDGGKGKDEIHAGQGDDFVFIHDAQQDTVFGDAGKDTITVTAGFTHKVDGGAGHDILDLRGIEASKFNFSNVTNIEEIWVNDYIETDAGLDDGKFIYFGQKELSVDATAGPNVFGGPAEELKVFGGNDFRLGDTGAITVDVNFLNLYGFTGLYDRPTVGDELPDGSDVIWVEGDIANGYVSASSAFQAGEDIDGTPIYSSDGQRIVTVYSSLHPDPADETFRFLKLGVIEEEFSGAHGDTYRSHRYDVEITLPTNALIRPTSFDIADISFEFV